MRRIKLICLVFFVALLISVVANETSLFDDTIRNAFYDARNGALTVFAKVITYIGNWQSIVLICLALLIFKKTRYNYGVPASIGAILVTVINKILKELVHRQRPEDIEHLVHAGGYSFPSGHSITSICVFGILAYLIYKNHIQKTTNKGIYPGLIVLLIFLMLSIGVTRIYLGVHFPTDVLAGWLLGIVICLEIITKTNKREQRVEK